ncbi:MAG TPA: tyrosine-type recombinase/integrase [Microvirga sp.]|jgi:integrase
MLTELFERWKAETQPSQSTVASWAPVVRSLSDHLGHEDISRIRTSDVVAWKDGLVATHLKAKTINATYLAALNAWLNYAVANGLLLANPASGVRVQERRRAGTAMLPYEDGEVVRLLDLAKQERLAPRRWLPWLAALSGARIGELAQLWGQRIRTVGGVTVMEIRAAEDGGSLKNQDSERTIPLHSALIADGFLEFVRERGRGPLFYGPRGGASPGRHPSKGVSNHLAEWIRRQGFRDKRKSPNHALRHWWKSAAVRSGMQDSLADAIQGHAAPSEAGRYRHFDLTTLKSAIESIQPPAPSQDQHRIG